MNVIIVIIRKGACRREQEYESIMYLEQWGKTNAQENLTLRTCKNAVSLSYNQMVR